MSMYHIEIAGVMRDAKFAPNNFGNDSAIFQSVLRELRDLGYETRVYTEQEFLERSLDEPVVLNMCREPESIVKLQALEQAGRLVINSGYGIANGGREAMTTQLIDGGVPHPKSMIVDTSDTDLQSKLEEFGRYPCWIKRGDGHVVERDDVCYCTCSGDAQLYLRRYRIRGISRAVICEHLEGDLIKFYGVQGQDWFHWFYPFDVGHSKYGFEERNGRSKGYSFDLSELKRICNDASVVLNVPIFGGDCVVGRDGEIRIIDFNDWPSFSPCREEGARAIARYVYNAIENYKREK